MKIKPQQELMQDEANYDQKMDKLINENYKLRENIDSMVKELNILKNQVINLNPEKKLPEHLKLLFAKIDELN